MHLRGMSQAGADHNPRKGVASWIIDEPTARVFICVPLQNTVLIICFCQPASAPSLWRVLKHSPSSENQGVSAAVAPRAVLAPCSLLVSSGPHILRGCCKSHYHPPFLGQGEEFQWPGAAKERFAQSQQSWGIASQSYGALHTVVVCLALALALIFCLHTSSAVSVLPAFSLKTPREQPLAFKAWFEGEEWLAHQPVCWVWLLS